MITIKNFRGRLGNQMFQIAAAVALAEKSRCEVVFPSWKYSDMFVGDFATKELVNTNSKSWRETVFHYTAIPPGTTEISGYFQSEKYFRNCSSKIREMFSIKQSIKDKIYDKHSHLLERHNVVSVHVRRGDYLRFPNHHPVMALDYFKAAIKKFPANAIFLIFSDDTKWCKNNLPGSGDDFFLIEGQSDIEDFAMMTMCDHAIIANSSFSWWSAWLGNNSNKIVVAPKKWFGAAYANIVTKDIYCEGWAVI